MRPSEAAALHMSDVDLERRTQVLREAQQRQALADAVLAASYDGVAILDGDGVFLEVNAAFERMTAIARDRWIGQHVEEMQQLPGVPKQSATLQALRDKRPASTLVNAGHGELVLITASPHLAGDGSVQNVILDMRNITQLNSLKLELERERGSAKLADLVKTRRSWLQSRLGTAELADLVLASPAMDDLLTTVAEIAVFDSTVLLEGETGTGKGLLARLLHRLSPRSGKPFVEVNCGALPEALVEAELFGHEAGAFTGSLRTGKKGQFELANCGTIFLDEIGELPLASQAKLLKVLDDKEIRPLGGATSRRLDVRVVRDQPRSPRAGRGGTLSRGPPLSHRSAPAARSAAARPARGQEGAALRLSRRCQPQAGRRKVLSLEVVAALGRYDFPGNVRELRNLVERLGEGVMTTRADGNLHRALTTGDPGFGVGSERWRRATRWSRSTRRGGSTPGPDRAARAPDAASLCPGLSLDGGGYEIARHTGLTQSGRRRSQAQVMRHQAVATRRRMGGGGA